MPAKPEASSKTAVADFVVDKETKGTFRYAEVEEGRAPISGSLYLKKYVFSPMPKRVRVTVEVVE